MILLLLGLQILLGFKFDADCLERQCVGRSCSVSTSISDEEILVIGQQIWNSDEYRLQVGLDLQSKTTRNKTDKATGPLCNNIPKEIFTLPVYKGLISLFDNYIAEDSKREEITASEQGEMDAFLETVMKTGPFRVVHEFLVSKGSTHSQCE